MSGAAGRVARGFRRVSPHAGSLAILLGCAAWPMHALAGAGAGAAFGVPAHPDDRFQRLLARIREAEIAANEAELAACTADAATIDAATIDADARTFADARIKLARAAIARRNAARSGAELARAEEEIATERLGVVRMTALPAARRELELEAAEDLLLRRLAADNSDTALALAVATAGERTAIETTLARARALLPVGSLQATLAANADDIATDPATFRAAMLGGVLALAESDLERDVAEDLPPTDATTAARLKRADERRAEAARLLGIASRTELPMPRAIADLLALARARAETTTSAGRERLLADASRAADPAVALVASIERAQAGMLPAGELARVDGTLAVIAACADARRHALALAGGARVAGDASSPDAGLASLLARTAASNAADARARSEAVAAVAAACALRFDQPMRAAASRPSATPLYAALASLRTEGNGWSVELAPGVDEALRALTDQAARDPDIATWFAIPYASALVRLDPANAGRAADLLLALAERTAPGERTRAALAIALDERRTRSARSAEDEARLAGALEIAARVFTRDASRDDWILESVDLALFPRYGTRDLDLAERLLAGVGGDAPARELRAIELAELRGPAARDLAPLRERAAANGRALATGSSALRARSDAVRASIARRAGDFAEAIARGADAVDADPASQAAERAAATWVASITSSAADDASTREGIEKHATATIVAPERLEDVAGRSPSTRNALLSAAESLAERVEGACDAGVAASADEALRTRLRQDGMRLAAIAAPLAKTPDGPRAETLRALGLLLSNDPAARAAARAALDGRPDDRGAGWVLGEALLRSDDASERAEGFAILRDLAPIGAAQRDRFWWRAQAAMLETIAGEVARGDARRAADLAARANRLESIDASLGGPAIARRIEAARATAKEAQRGGRDTGGAGNAGSRAAGTSGA